MPQRRRQGPGARALAGWLVRDSYKVSFDKTLIIPGDHITLHIADALEHTCLLLFLISAASQQDAWPHSSCTRSGLAGS